MAMENVAFILDLPIKNGGSFHSYVSHYQRVHITTPLLLLQLHGRLREADIWPKHCSSNEDTVGSPAIASGAKPLSQRKMHLTANPK